MQALIITIGDELLNGTTIDTNAAWIASAMNNIGIDIARILTIPDRKEAILETLEETRTSEISLVLMTGGLGPTDDDITRQCLAGFFHVEMQFHEDIFERIQELFAKRRIKMQPGVREQAMLPANCEALPNTLGTAPGMWFISEGKAYVSMPGVPHEMRGIMEHVVIPRLQSSYRLPGIVHRHILTSGAGESFIAAKIAHLAGALPPHIGLAYLPTPGMVKLRLTARGEDVKSLRAEVGKISAAMCETLGDLVFGFDSDTLESVTGEMLKALHASIGTAESCTGGRIAARLTSVPGCSDYFKGSVVSYANSVKHSLLGVPDNVISQYGAVSKETVEAMLSGALRVLDTDYALAVSGIAGPGGGTAEKPVGTIYIGVAGKGESHVQSFLFGNARIINMEYAVNYALHALRLLLQKHLAKASQTG